MTNLEFIQKIAPYIQKYAIKYDIKVVSPIIAQACLQSSYGNSYKAKFHNYFGLKYRAGRLTVNNGYFQDGGSEQNSDGSYSLLPTSTSWYAFDSMQKGVEGYFQFINISNYANVKTTSDPLKYLQYLKADNYATDKNYVQKVYSVITQWNLTTYDNLSQKEDKKENMSEISIIKKTNITNTTAKANRSINWIVIHYTAGVSSNSGAAAGVASWFSNSAAQGSADFIVDDTQIVQYNPDPENRYCWAVGGSKYTSFTTSLGGKYYGQCMNNNSISIEMCSRKQNTRTLNASDTDWYFTEATIANAIQLTKYLMQKYNIDINHVIMHHMVTGKVCPNPWTVNQSRLTQWYTFLEKVNGAAVPKATTPTLTQKTTSGSNSTTKTTTINKTAVPFLVTIKTSNLRIRSGPSSKYTICGYVQKGITYTIVEVQNGWGKLKSGAGWIYLSSAYVTRK